MGWILSLAVGARSGKSLLERRCCFAVQACAACHPRLCPATCASACIGHASCWALRLRQQATMGSGSAFEWSEVYRLTVLLTASSSGSSSFKASNVRHSLLEVAAGFSGPPLTRDDECRGESRTSVGDMELRKSNRKPKQVEREAKQKACCVSALRCALNALQRRARVEPLG